MAKKKRKGCFSWGDSRPPMGTGKRMQLCAGDVIDSSYRTGYGRKYRITGIGRTKGWKAYNYVNLVDVSAGTRHRIREDSFFKNWVRKGMTTAGRRRLIVRK